MAMAGYNPATAIPFWQRMAAQSQNSTPEFLSDHPADATRIAGHRSEEIESLLGWRGRDELIHRDDLVLLT